MGGMSERSTHADRAGHAVRDYAAVTGAYWVFTLSDGALRMLVLLHLHGLGLSPLAIVSLFLFYELFGVATNLFGGWLGARRGLRAALLAGLGLQVASLGGLSFVAGAAVLWPYLVTQAASGVAKDLTKASAKSFLKLVVPAGDGHGLLRWVSWLTGSKNALKGAGFFLGGLLLHWLGFAQALRALAAAVALAWLASLVLLPPAAGRSAAKPGLRALVSRDPRVNWLSGARLCLFAARDAWFVLALPVYLSSSVGWSHPAVGGLLALWVIGYGLVQGLAPSCVSRGGRPPTSGSLPSWTAALVLPLVALSLAARFDALSTPLLIAGLALFGVVFAACSALHSFLIVAYADRSRVSLDVGFYYTANAAGRLLGTLLSGALFQAAGLGVRGLAACLGGSLVLILLATLGSVALARTEVRSRMLPDPP